MKINIETRIQELKLEQLDEAVKDNLEYITAEIKKYEAEMKRIDDSEQEIVEKTNNLRKTLYGLLQRKGDIQLQIRQAQRRFSHEAVPFSSLISSKEIAQVDLMKDSDIKVKEKELMTLSAKIDELSMNIDLLLDSIEKLQKEKKAIIHEQKVLQLRADSLGKKIQEEKEKKIIEVIEAEVSLFLNTLQEKIKAAQDHHQTFERSSLENTWLDLVADCQTLKTEISHLFQQYIHRPGSSKKIENALLTTEEQLKSLFQMFFGAEQEQIKKVLEDFNSKLKFNSFEKNPPCFVYLKTINDDVETHQKNVFYFVEKPFSLFYKSYNDEMIEIPIKEEIFSKICNFLNEHVYAVEIFDADFTLAPTQILPSMIELYFSWLLNYHHAMLPCNVGASIDDCLKFHIYQECFKELGLNFHFRNPAICSLQQQCNLFLDFKKITPEQLSDLAQNLRTKLSEQNQKEGGYKGELKYKEELKKVDSTDAKQLQASVSVSSQTLFSSFSPQQRTRARPLLITTIQPKKPVEGDQEKNHCTLM